MIEAFAALSLLLAGERSFLHFPRSDEVRIQAIAKSDNERDWPFTVDSGSLTCVWSAGEPVVMFFAKTAESFDESEVFDEDGAELVEPRGVLLSTNPLELTLGNMANNDLFVKTGSVEQRLRAVAPFVAVGQRLCDQPPGAQIRGGEL